MDRVSLCMTSTNQRTKQIDKRLSRAATLARYTKPTPAHTEGFTPHVRAVATHGAGRSSKRNNPNGAIAKKIFFVFSSWYRPGWRVGDPMAKNEAGKEKAQSRGSRGSRSTAPSQPFQSWESTKSPAPRPQLQTAETRHGRRRAKGSGWIPTSCDGRRTASSETLNV